MLAVYFADDWTGVDIATEFSVLLGLGCTKTYFPAAVGIGIHCSRREGGEEGMMRAAVLPLLISTLLEHLVSQGDFKLLLF